MHLGTELYFNHLDSLFCLNYGALPSQVCLGPCPAWCWVRVRGSRSCTASPTIRCGWRQAPERGWGRPRPPFSAPLIWTVGVARQSGNPRLSSVIYSQSVFRAPGAHWLGRQLVSAGTVSEGQVPRGKTRACRHQLFPVWSVTTCLREEQLRQTIQKTSISYTKNSFLDKYPVTNFIIRLHS